MSEAHSERGVGYRAGVFRELAEYDELPVEELRTDSLHVTFPDCRISYANLHEWDRISASIAPSRSGSEYAFTKASNGALRRKSQSRDGGWKHASWFAELSHYPSDGGGRLIVKLKLNPTRFEAFRALGRPRHDGGAEQVHLTLAQKAAQLQSLTLDKSTNFIPAGYRRYTYRHRREMMLAAFEQFRVDLLTNLSRSGVQVHEVGGGERDEVAFSSRGPGCVLLDWRNWRVDRLEQYVEVKTPDAVKAVRLGYLDARARHHSIASRLYAEKEYSSSQIGSDLDRNRRAISYETRTNPQNHLIVYAKAQDVVRIERRWIRGEGQPEVGFSRPKSLGFYGLVGWVQRMNPGSRKAIAPVERRLAQLVNSGADSSELWAKLCSHVAEVLEEPADIASFLAHIVEYGGMTRTGQPRKVVMLLSRLEVYGLVEQVNKRENVVAVPALAVFLATLREVSEVACARQNQSTDG